jgi:FkbM family methyltransferase
MPDFATRARRFIARRRGSTWVRALHRLAGFVESAYQNDEWDMTVNGEATVLRRLAPAGFLTIFDVGAHVGGWTIEALRAWPGAHSHAFEVADPTFARLRQEIDRAGLGGRCTLNPFGLSDATGPREMFYFADHPQYTCDRRRHDDLPASSFVAQLMDGDSYVVQHGIDVIDFLKIDVEGAEHLVLDGLRRTIEAGRIHCIQFEYGAFSIDTRVLLADYYAQLAPLYWIGKIFPAHVEFADYDWTMESFRFANFVCVSRARPDLRSLVESGRADRVERSRRVRSADAA